MNRQISPVFRKAINGYNKEDVNSYIINMSKKYAETEIGYKNEISRLNAELQKSNKANEDGKIYTNKLEYDKDIEIKALKKELEDMKNALSEKEAELESVVENMHRTSHHSKLSDSFGGITDDNEKAMLFDCISSKTGEIMLIACKTADDIIAKAKKEADDIVSEANSKKDNMLRSISGSADIMTSDISAYIKNAVDGCLDKIYSSIKSVDSESK